MVPHPCPGCGQIIPGYLSYCGVCYTIKIQQVTKTTHTWGPLNKVPELLCWRCNKPYDNSTFDFDTRSYHYRCSSCRANEVLTLEAVEQLISVIPRFVSIQQQQGKDKMSLLQKGVVGTIEAYREMHLVLSALIQQYGEQIEPGKYRIVIKDDSFVNLMFDAHTIYGMPLITEEGGKAWVICLENPPEKS